MRPERQVLLSTSAAESGKAGMSQHDPFLSGQDASTGTGLQGICMALGSIIPSLDQLFKFSSQVQGGASLGVARLPCCLGLEEAGELLQTG